MCIRDRIVCNNEDFLKLILSSKNKTGLTNEADYIHVRQALGKLVEEKDVSFRQFGRVDRVLETNYEMLRQGKMATSKTLLARIVNQIVMSAQEPEQESGPPPRTQKLDGSKLTADYANLVAPYFGPTGWTLETQPDGWRITGCMLKKNNGELVRRPESTAATR